MAVVKANGYGHGAVAAAQAAVRGGADWLGVVHVAEALEVRRAGVEVPLLCLMAIGTDDHVAAIAAERGPCRRVGRHGAADRGGRRAAGRPARVHLKADTGLAGAGPRRRLAAVLATARAAERDGSIVIAGVWSHFASADEPGNPSIDAQLSVFKEALAVAEHAGITRSSGTSRTPPPRSTCRRRATTWSGWAAAATASPRCPAERRRGCGPR